METNTRSNKRRYIFAGAIALAALNISCMDNYLPESLDSFDKDAAFSETQYTPRLGRTSVVSQNFNPGNSTLPMTFTITSITHADGSPAPELTDFFPVRVWKTPYLGTETTLAEIEAKRTYENRQLFQVREHSGEMVLWENAVSSFVKCSPDEGYVFDVHAENSGGYKDYTGLKLKPEREMDYEPNTTDDNGFVTEDYVHPTDVSMMFKEGGAGGYATMQPEDVQIYFRRNYDNTDKENTLTFRFLKQDYTPLNPANFKQTKWAELLHGFDMEMTDEYVRYKVAYPIPLNTIKTKYTNAAGDMAHIQFKYDRIYWNNYRITATMDFEFAIYKEGHWEIVFVFAGGNPEFRDNV